MTPDLVYQNYWQRKRRLGEGAPHFPLRRWWPSAGLCDVEKLCFDAVKDASSLLDVGAGDLRVMRKFQAAGYRGTYHTLDVGAEHDYTYRDLSQVQRAYEAILCLDVIEHLPLREGLALLDRLLECLSPEGVLVLQTPNARCVRNPLSWDMTHVHLYNLPDLWAYLTCRDMTVDGYRVVFQQASRSPFKRIRRLIEAFVATRILGGDYADNILLVARKKNT